MAAHRSIDIAFVVLGEGRGHMTQASVWSSYASALMQGGEVSGNRGHIVSSC
jgi:hypothetical protein